MVTAPHTVSGVADDGKIDTTLSGMIFARDGDQKTQRIRVMAETLLVTTLNTHVKYV